MNKKDIVVIENDLKNKQSAKRRAAAKKIGKEMIAHLGDALFDAYLNEKEDDRTWETQSEMISALGRINYKKLLPYVSKIVKKNIELDAITRHAATAYIRLKRKTSQDIAPIFELLKIGKHSVQFGAINALIFDEIVPQKTDIVKLVKLINKSKHIAEADVMDTREVLACAMSKWPKDIVSKYLIDYKKISSISKDIIDDSLHGKTYYKEY